MLARLLSAAALMTLSTVALADTSTGGPTATKGMKAVVLPDGLEFVDVRKGTGAEAKAGKKVKVHYTGWLADSKKKFDSSVDRHEPIEFPLGTGRVIKGWDEGLEGMKVGGRRQLHIPAKLGYGAEGYGDSIPPNADLIFDVALVDVQ
ncbi:MAG: fbp [Myxococcales bacterium]|nr:fbp [Myxococcales bacterium]